MSDILYEIYSDTQVVSKFYIRKLRYCYLEIKQVQVCGPSKNFISEIRKNYDKLLVIWN